MAAKFKRDGVARGVVYWHGNYYSGFVERLEPVLQSHRIATTTTWGIRTSITHGCTNDAGSKQELLEDGDGEKENDPSMVGNYLS